ncbi:MAG: hypothetical protein SOW21_06600 [[Actinobacillus] rossii]|nr:hypothetical protein [[Actinobacillus] rossii]
MIVEKNFMRLLPVFQGYSSEFYREVLSKNKTITSSQLERELEIFNEIKVLYRDIVDLFNELNLDLILFLKAECDRLRTHNIVLGENDVPASVMEEAVFYLKILKSESS